MVEKWVKRTRLACTGLYLSTTELDMLCECWPRGGEYDHPAFDLEYGIDVVAIDGSELKRLS
jgi:hypothetical protein